MHANFVAKEREDTGLFDDIGRIFRRDVVHNTSHKYVGEFVLIKVQQVKHLDARSREITFIKRGHHVLFSCTGVARNWTTLTRNCMYFDLCVLKMLFSKTFRKVRNVDCCICVVGSGRITKQVHKVSAFPQHSHKLQGRSHELKNVMSHVRVQHPHLVLPQLHLLPLRFRGMAQQHVAYPWNVHLLRLRPRLQLVHE